MELCGGHEEGLTWLSVLRRCEICLPAKSDGACGNSFERSRELVSAGAYLLDVCIHGQPAARRVQAQHKPSIYNG